MTYSKQSPLRLRSRLTLIGLFLSSSLLSCSDSAEEAQSTSSSNDNAGNSSALPAQDAAGGAPGQMPGRPQGPPPWVDDGKERPNILLVVMDTLRRDATGLGDAAEREQTAPTWPLMAGGLTPNLDALAEESAVFTQAFSVAPWTIPAHASIFTGILPIGHGCTALHPRLNRVGPTIAEALARVGYDTAAFYSNPWLSQGASGMLRGFATQTESTIGNLDTLITEQGDQGGPQTLKNVDSWLGDRKSEKPFLMFVNILEAHLPYAPPPAIRNSIMPPLPANESTTIQWAHEFNAGLHPSAGVDWNLVHGLYAADVRFADEVFGTLLKVLQKHDVYDDTIIIVTSDHGENLGDHDLMEHQFSVHESLLAVPLLARVPDGSLPKGRYPHPVMTTDIYSTISELAIAEAPKQGRHSVSLLRTAKITKRKRHRAIYADYSNPHTQLIEFLGQLNPDKDMEAFDVAYRSVRMGSWRLTASSADKIVLHDMLKDPKQTTDVSAENEKMTAGLRGMLVKSQPKTPLPRVPQQPMDAETAKQLKGLGYMAGDGDEDEK